MLEKSPSMGRRITYKDLAEATGLGESTIERYANDRQSDPPYRIVRALAVFFGVSVEYFMRDSENRFGINESEMGQWVAARMN
jgi:transcriptional regulator with XRE-family HTH domain